MGESHPGRHRHQVRLLLHSCKDEKIFNNAAQHWNHTFYWYCITPDQTQPSPQIKALIEAKWGSVANFITEFSAQAVGNFGSGWTWLVKKEGGELAILNTSNAGNPLTGNFKPLLTVDVWEHAYYIDYRNVRATYVSNFTNIINWNFVNDNFKSEHTTLKF
jgi:superoxide dismutase, Fe-Mn family